MAFFVSASSDVIPPMRRHRSGEANSARRISALLGGGVFAALCTLATFATMHSMATAAHQRSALESVLLSHLAPARPAIAGAARKRHIHVSKFSRLSGNRDDHPDMMDHDFDERYHGDAVTASDVHAPLPNSAEEAQRDVLVKAMQARNSEAGDEHETAEHPAFAAALAVQPVPVSRPASLDIASRQLPASIPLPTVRPVARVTEPAEASGSSTMLAFARPENPVRPTVKSGAVPWPDRGSGTAIYDISAGIVHMPDGEKLEAHSGIGRMRDNPQFVHVKMRGSTPPATYALTMREALFHGIEAIRLTPTNGIKPHGRDGLLAHTYMLAQRGESNGCVVFKEYHRFLAAFKRGEVRRMVVVAKLGDRPADGGATESVNSGGRKTLVSLFSKGV